MTAAPAARAIWMQGTLARMRVSSVMLPSSACGTFKSARMKTRCPAAWPLAHKSEKRMTFMKKQVQDQEKLPGILKAAPDKG
jgi:hypothetical protein